MKFHTARFCCLSLFFTVFFKGAYASILPLDQPQVTPDIKILSDQIDCNQSQNKCVAKGHASAEKLNDARRKILNAEQIIAHFPKKKEGESGPVKVSFLEASGEVILFIDDVIIQGRQATYNPETEIAEISGDVKITTGGNQIEGSYGKVNMKTGHYTLKREKERVQALIYTKGNNGRGKK